MEVTQQVEQEIRTIFPGLSFLKKDKGITSLEGKLEFNARFVPEFNNYEFLDSANKNADVSGTFQIEAILSAKNPYREVYEVGGEIEKMAERLGYGSELFNLHAQKRISGSDKVNVCLSGYFQEDPNIGLKQFICDVVVPFFCDLVYFEANKVWLRGETKHFLVGLFQSYGFAISEFDINDSNIEIHTKRCLDEFVKQTNDADFEIYKKLLLYKGRLKGVWQREFLRPEKVDCESSSIIKHMGKDAYTGLWKFKENLQRFNLQKNL